MLVSPPPDYGKLPSVARHDKITFLTKAKENKASGQLPYSTTALYTDGGCIAKPSPTGNTFGSFAWYAELPSGKTPTRAVGVMHTTNNRMEMRALLDALLTLEIGPPIRVFSDSAYLIGGMTQWWPNWVKNGWKTSTGLPVANVDLWEQLIAFGGMHNLSFEKVKGHSGNVGNETVDCLCTQALAKIRQEHSLGFLGDEILHYEHGL